MKRRDFIVKIEDKEVMLSFKAPSLDELEEADRIYASKMSSLIREGGKSRLMLRQEVDKFLKESGIWTDEDDKRIQQLNKDINDLLNKLKKGGIKLSEGKQISLDIRDKRIEIFTTIRKRQILDNTTIESIAQNERNDYLIYVCTVYAETGKDFWTSFDDMKNDKFNEVYAKASEISLELVYGITPDFEKELPENKWLKKYNFVDDNLNYINRKTGEKIDREGSPIKKEEDFVLATSIEDALEPFIEDV